MNIFIAISTDEFILMWTKWGLFFAAGCLVYGAFTLNLADALAGFFVGMFYAIVRNMADRPKGN